jgi:glycosyltransferase involved in cell wall biosynthesis
MTAVQIISKSNGFGLTLDVALLAQALQTCNVEVVVKEINRRDARRRRSRLVRYWAHARRRWQLRHPANPARFDTNLMIEHLWPEFAAEARVNIAIPNPEWFDHRDRRSLSLIDWVWAKTDNTQRIFTQAGKRACLIGFDSRDRHDAAVQRQPVCLHVAGKSQLKGTEPLLALWRRHPHWPKLIVVQPNGRLGYPAAPNIEYRQEYLDDAELRRLQNECLFHLCPSEAEGWGHYIVEAMSVGAIVITVDAAPMNELITAERGLLVRRQAMAIPQNLGERFLFDESLRDAMEVAIQMPATKRELLGKAARHWFLANQAGFNARIAAALALTRT